MIANDHVWTSRRLLDSLGLPYRDNS
jgi:hypothetical protein